MSRQGNRFSRISIRLSLAIGLAISTSAAMVPQFPVHYSQAIAQTAPIGTNILYVNSVSGNDQPAAGKTEAAPYRTITFALQQATAGTVIQLAPGQYTNGEKFPIALKPGVILRGNESGKGQGILISGFGTYVSKTFAGQNVAVLMAQGSELRGVTVTNAGSRGSGVWVEDVNAAIVGNTFTNNVREGVFVTGSAAPTISDNVFTQNGGNGIAVEKNARGQIKNNVFLNTGFGLAVGGNSAPVIDGNQISQNKSGLYINANARPVLRNNVITDNTEDGITATSAAQPDLGTAESNGNNTIRNNKSFDVNNSTSGTIVAIGNNIDPKKISGKVEFVASGGGVFADVQGHWAQAYIQALASKKIITGFPDGSFKPNDPVTRVQFAAIILKAFAPTAKKPATEFSDVRSNYWGYTAIQAAARGGFMTGYPGGIFDPERRIPRVQTLVALVNGLELGAGNAALLSKYQDAARIPSWGTNQVAAATQARIVVNYPTVGQLNPEREATRAEVAAFVYQALVSAGKEQAIPSPYIVNP
jgi:parallel beta-helix repeat protein